MKGKWASSQWKRGRQREVGFVAKTPRFASRNTWTERGRCYVLLAAARRLAREFKVLGFWLTVLALPVLSLLKYRIIHKVWNAFKKHRTSLISNIFFLPFCQPLSFFLSRKLLHSCNLQEKKWLCSAFLHTFPQPVTTSAHAHLQAASNKLGSTSVESSWLQFSDFSSLTAKSCLVRMELYNILNKFFKIHHTQHIENYTTIEQYLQLESFRERFHPNH